MQIELLYRLGFLSHRDTPNHPSHELVLKTMVTWGSPILGTPIQSYLILGGGMIFWGFNFGLNCLYVLDTISVKSQK